MPSEWIRHNNVRPVPEDVLVQLKFRSGTISGIADAGTWTWDDSSEVYRIIDTNTWIPHTEGVMPVPPNTPVYLQLRNDSSFNNTNVLITSPSLWDWGCWESNIIAWRLPDAGGSVISHIPPIPIPYHVRDHKTWQEREMDLLYLRPVKCSGYTPISKDIMKLMKKYGFKPPVLHYLHQCQHDKSQVAFTENEKKGEVNRQTVLRMGKYLKRYSNMTDPQIANIANMYRNEAMGGLDVKFARSREEIASVYINGPRSCMAGTAHSFDTDGIHPSEVYATPDISVAYLLRDGRITARVVCNEIKKQFSRVYGDDQSFVPVLKDLGYTKGDLEGCSLLRLTNNEGRLIAPFLDGEQGITDEGDRLEVTGHNPNYLADKTNGLLEEGRQCDDCGDFHSEDDLLYVDDREMFICNDCLDNGDWLYVYSGQYQEVVNIHDHHILEYEGENYLEGALSYHNLIYCSYSDEVLHEDDAIWCEKDNDYSNADDATYYVDSYGESQYTAVYSHEVIQPEDFDEPMLKEDCTYLDGYYKDDPREGQHSEVA